MWRQRPYLRRAVLALLGFVAGLWLIGCGASARYTLSEQVGAQPTLPPPDPSLIPVIDVVSARGWTEGKRPDPIAGTSVNAFARDLEHPRWLYVLPNGDVLVAETNGPVRPDDNTSTTI
jgi:glucose/arabinose dehydrogenase